MICARGHIMSVSYIDRFQHCIAGGEVDQLADQLAYHSLPQENVVCCGDFGGIKIDIRDFTKRRPYAYNPSRFDTATDRLIVGKQPITLLVFSTGRVVLTGAKWPVQAVAAMHKLRLDLARSGIRPKRFGFAVENMIFKTSIPGVVGINIALWHRDNMEISKFRPAVFPAVVFNLGDGISLRAFDTNKLNLTGTDDPIQAEIIFNQVYRLDKKYLMNHLPPPSKRYKFRLNCQRHAFFDMPTNMPGACCAKKKRQ